MLDNLSNFFDTSGFMPHGNCFFWTPSLLWIYVVSDLVIAASYFSIPFALWYFVQKRPDLPFRWIFVMFGAFVLACGTTHLFALWNIWHADYWGDAAVKAVTAAVSVATAILLWPMVPEALRIPSQALLQNANRELRDEAKGRAQAEAALLAANEALERRVAERTQELQSAGSALRAAEEQFRGLVEQSIAGIFIIQDRKFAYVNPRLCEIHGYASQHELTGVDPVTLTAEEDRAAAAETMRQLLDSGANRISHTLTGLRKDGATVELGINSARASFRGRPAIIGMVQDISEKKRAEEEIRRYVEQLKTAFMSTVEVATSLSEMRDPYTAGHERRVGKIAAAIGAELGLDARRQEGLEVAGHLHDIGKITVPAEILSKPGKLSAIEYQLIQGHPQAAYDVLKRVEFPWPVAEVALQHHERIDGSGYPQGLKGEAILFEARILAVADVVEAMSSHRPYRPGLGIEKTLAEIERGRGIVYDTAVADACLRLFREGRYKLPA